MLADLGTSIQQGKPWSGLVKSACKNGKHVWCRLNAGPLFSRGKYIGTLMVLGKPDAEDVSKTEKLYRVLLSDQRKEFGWRQGRLVRQSFFGKALERGRSLGLRRYLWSCMAALDVLGILGLVIFQGDAAILSFWLALVVLLSATTAVGAYLSHVIVAPLQGAVHAAMKIAAGDLSAVFTTARSDEIGDVIRVLN